jgi:hypothetical protein
MFTTWSAKSQEVVYSAYDKFDLRNGDFSVIGKVGGKIYTYRGGTDGYYLDAFDDSMNKLATIVLDFFPKKIYQTKFIASSSQIVVLYQAIDGTKITQHAALMDDAGRLLKGPILLGSAKTGLLGTHKDYFHATFSDDKKQIVVYNMEEEGDELRFSGTWMDDQLVNIQRSTATFKANNNLSAGEGMVDNNGTFFISAFTTTGAKDLADKLWMLSLPRGMRKFYSAELDMSAMYAGSVYMKMDNVNRRIYAGGFYSDKKNGNYEGVLYAYYDLADSSFHNKKFILFDEKLRTETGERNTRRALNNFEAKQMIVRKDGGFVLISEDFYVGTRTTGAGWGSYYSGYYSPFMSQPVREYSYEDVLALSYDADGNKQWHSFVRKTQYSQEDGGVFSSYALINTGGTLGMMFNDFNTRVSKVQLATIDSKGMVEMHSLASNSGNDPDWLPRSARQTGLKEVVVPCLRRRQICFAKIVF